MTAVEFVERMPKALHELDTKGIRADLVVLFIEAVREERRRCVKLIENFFENDPADEHERIRELVRQVRETSK